MCSRALLSKLAAAQETFRNRPLSVDDTVQRLLAKDGHNLLPWYDVGQFICNDVWVALFLHFDRLIPPPTFFQKNTKDIFSENLVVATADMLGNEKGKETGAESAGTKGDRAPPKEQPSKSCTEDSTPPPPPLSPRSKSRIEQLDSLNVSIVDRSAQVDVIERQVETEVSAPDKFMGVGGAFEKDLVDARTIVSRRRLGLHANELAQMYGTLEKLQFTKVDAIITGDLSSGRAEAKQKRKQLTKTISAVMERVVRVRKQVIALEKR